MQQLLLVELIHQDDLFSMSHCFSMNGNMAKCFSTVFQWIKERKTEMVNKNDMHIIHRSSKHTRTHVNARFCVGEKDDADRQDSLPFVRHRLKDVEYHPNLFSDCRLLIEQRQKWVTRCCSDTKLSSEKNREKKYVWPSHYNCRSYWLTMHRQNELTNYRLNEICLAIILQMSTEEHLISVSPISLNV